MKRGRRSFRTVGGVVDPKTREKLTHLDGAECPFTTAETLELLRQAIQIHRHIVHVGRPPGAQLRPPLAPYEEEPRTSADAASATSLSGDSRSSMNR